MSQANLSWKIPILQEVGYLQLHPLWLFYPNYIHYKMFWLENSLLNI